MPNPMPSHFTKIQIKPTRGNPALVNAVLTVDGSLTVLANQATSLFDVICPVGGRAGGLIVATVEATDGTDVQSMTVMATYAGVNKAGAFTVVINDLATADAKAVTGASTLTLAWSALNGTNKFTVQLTPTGSLTTTIYDVTFFVFATIGPVIPI